MGTLIGPSFRFVKIPIRRGLEIDKDRFGQLKRIPFREDAQYMALATNV
jgi:hypothetical protein